MDRKDFLEKELVDEIRSLAQELCVIQTYPGLLVQQQKVQLLYEKYIFLKQLNSAKYQDILEPAPNEKKPNIISEPINIEPCSYENANFFRNDPINKDFCSKENIAVSKPYRNEEEEIASITHLLYPDSKPQQCYTEEKTVAKNNFLTDEFANERKRPTSVYNSEPEKNNMEESIKNLSADLYEKAVSTYNYFATQELGLKPIKLDFNDSIAFISQLFKGNKNDMDREISLLNQTKNISEAKKWLETMFFKYSWQDKREYVERLSSLIVNRFE